LGAQYPSAAHRACADASVNAMLSIIMGLLFGLGVIGLIGIIYISKVLARFDRTQ
jgi:hypothetical protein